ncbi:hypothetical protein CK203_012748 [Vitis vinifera]|uniref:Uncharacterized protein n=1 Tax=Vitis vinifera TaxID=29760 RepID=A0A438KMY4_VITVI|nr:hypothetical protein CK203_012748 [Vitis vinifera]
MDEGVANRDTPLVLDEVAVAIQPSQTTLIPNLHNEEHENGKEHYPSPPSPQHAPQRARLCDGLIDSVASHLLCEAIGEIAAMEDARSKYPSLPSNYVSILQLQQRWIKEQQRIQEEEEKGRKQDRESHSPTEDNDPTQNDTRPKFKGRRKDGLRRQKPRAAKVKADRWTDQVESQNPEQAEVGCQKPESLKVKKDGRTVEDYCQKSEMEAMVVVGEEIKDDEQTTAGLKKKKKKNRKTKSRAEEELAGGTVQPVSKNGNEDKFPGRVNQIDGIQRRMEKLSVDPGKVGGSHRSTSPHMNDGYRRKPGVSGRWRSHKATGAGLVWVRKGEASDGNVARTSCSGGSGSQR